MCFACSASASRGSISPNPRHFLAMTLGPPLTWPCPELGGYLPRRAADRGKSIRPTTSRTCREKKQYQNRRTSRLPIAPGGDHVACDGVQLHPVDLVRPVSAPVPSARTAGQTQIGNELLQSLILAPQLLDLFAAGFSFRVPAQPRLARLREVLQPLRRALRSRSVRRWLRRCPDHTLVSPLVFTVLGNPGEYDWRGKPLVRGILRIP